MPALAESLPTCALSPRSIDASPASPMKSDGYAFCTFATAATIGTTSLSDFADQQPHAGAQALASLVGRVGLVVGADAGGGVGLQRVAEHARRVAVDVFREREL